MNYKVLARFIGVLEQKRLKVWTFLGAFFMVLSFCSLFKPYMLPLPLLNFRLSRGMNLKMLSIIEAENEVTNLSQQTGEISKPETSELQRVPPICDFSGEKSDYCEMNGDIRIHGNASSIFFTSPQMKKAPENSTIGIKIYARKKDDFLMTELIKEQKLITPPTTHKLPRCTVNYTIPAVVFNGGGYAGNLFHAISDVMIPLYLTTRQFNGEVRFLIEDKYSWWVQKYEIMLKAFSNYEFIDLNHDNEIRCFKNAVLGLKAHGDFGIDPQKPPLGYTLRNFTQFMRQTFSLERDKAVKLKAKDNHRKPRLLIISRRETRVLLNEDEVEAEAQGLGFDVEIIDARGKLIKDFSKMVNSFDVMIGVHGAGLTNMVFLPENAVLIQVTPLGLENVARIFYERPARNMNLKYLEYRVSKNESSLLDKYPIDHPVIIDPRMYESQGWLKFKSIYLETQNVRVDMSRFTRVLLEALELLCQ